MKTISTIILLINLIVSCGNSEEKNTSVEHPASTAGVADCIMSYQTKYDQLLPLEAIKKHYTLPSEAKMIYNKITAFKKRDKDSYEYTWESGRTRKMKMMGQEMDVPQPNRIGLRWVGSDLFMIQGKPTPLENFKGFYKNTTAAEKEAAFKKAGDALKEKGYDEKTSKTAMEMAKDLSADEIIFKDITGVGEAASWRIKEKELTVLVGKITFQIVVDLSSNDEENIALAKKLASEVLTKCK
jgi:hypothetical protein